MMILTIVCESNYREDQKNQKILVGSGSLAVTSVLFIITLISSQQSLPSPFPTSQLPTPPPPFLAAISFLSP